MQNNLPVHNKGGLVVDIASPLMVLVEDESLNGSRGTNRTISSTLRANNDIDAIAAWIDTVQVQTTKQSYLKEAVRLILWAQHQRRLAVSSLTHEDFMEYRKFLANPLPAEKWIGKKLPRQDPNWKPFERPLSKASCNQSFIIINSMFNWLVDARYLAANPIALMKRQKARSSGEIARFLPGSIWDEVMLTISELPEKTTRQVKAKARLRWIFALLFLTGMRISEMLNNTMGSFYSKEDSQGHLKWWLEVTGKGDKTRKIPVTADLLSELQRYREANDLKAYPATREKTPLVLPIIERDSSNYDEEKPMARSRVHTLIKDLFNKTAKRYKDRGPEFDEQAARLRSASAHWLRHTSASHQASRSDLIVVRDNLGHSNIQTTNAYLHQEDELRHQATEESFKGAWKQ